MAGEHEPIDTVVSLRTYFDRVLLEKDKALNLAFAKDEEAKRLAAAALEVRLEKMNELRSEVLEDRSTYITKEMFEVYKRNLTTDSNQHSQWSIQMIVIGGLALGSFVIGLITLLNHLGGTW